MKLDDLARGHAPQALVRALRKVLAEERCTAVLLAALEAADAETLPSDPGELAFFVRTRVVVPLMDEIGPRLTIAIFDEFTADMTRVATADDPNLANGMGERAKGAHASASSKKAPARLPSANQRHSVADPVRTASTRIRGVIGAGRCPLGARPSRHRCAVFLVDNNRVTRASMARALVNAWFDVGVFDATTQVLAAPRNPADPVVVIVDMSEDGLESTLRTLMGQSPATRIVAWTETDRRAAEDLLIRAGARKFVVVPKTGAELELVDAVRRLVGS